MSQLPSVISDEPSCDAKGRLAENVYCATKECGYNLRGVNPGGACPECGKSIAESIEENRFRDIPGLTLYRFGLLARCICIFFGAITAVGAFGIVGSIHGPLLVEWQSGELRDYIGMLLGGSSTRPFYPLILLAIGSLIAMVIRPIDMARQSLVRIGIYTGVLLGVQYTLILFGSIGALLGLLVGVLVIVGVAVLSIVTLKLPWYLRERYQFKGWGTQKWFRITAWIIGVLLTLGFVFGGAWIFFLLLSPIFFMMVYASLWIRILNSRLGRPSSVPAWWVWLLGWLGVYFTAWGGAIALAIDAYRALPTQPPDCYVCTAAARGHRRVVGVTMSVAGNGSAYAVNQQMRVLKAMELALATMIPRGHHGLRWIYDRVGPCLAQRIRHPLFADVAYLTLKPLEVVAYSALRVLCPDANRRIAGLYRSCADR